MKDILVNDLSRELDRTFKGYYELKFRSISTSIDWNGLSISIEKPTFTSDTSKHELNKKFPTLFFKSDQLELKHISIRKLLFSNDMELHSLKLKKPNLKLIIFDSTNVDEKQVMQKSKKKIINFLSIKKINIEKGTMACSHYNDLLDTTFMGMNINSKIENIYVQVSKLKKLVYTLKSENKFSVSIQRSFYKPYQSNYVFEMDSLLLDDKNKFISAKNISETTLKSKLEISRLFKYSTTISETNIGSFFIQGYNLKELILQNTIVLRAVKLDHVQLDLFKNKKRQLNKQQERLLIQEMLTTLPFFLKVDTLKITNSNLVFEVIDYKTKSPVIIDLNDLNLRVEHINTFKGSLDTMILYGSGKIMHRATFDIKVVFPNIYESEHYYSGSVGQMSFQKFNPIMSSYSGIQFVDGSIHSIVYSGKCNKYENNGSLVFRYSNLKIETKKTTSRGVKKQARLMSFLGNLILENSNPRKKDEAAVRYSYYLKREKYQSHITLLFNGILEGVKNTLVDKKLHEKIKRFNLKKLKKRKGN